MTEEENFFLWFVLFCFSFFYIFCAKLFISKTDKRLSVKNITKYINKSNSELNDDKGSVKYGGPISQSKKKKTIFNLLSALKDSLLRRH